MFIDFPTPTGTVAEVTGYFLLSKPTTEGFTAACVDAEGQCLVKADSYSFQGNPHYTELMARDVARPAARNDEGEVDLLPFGEGAVVFLGAALAPAGFQVCKESLNPAGLALVTALEKTYGVEGVLATLVREV